jgi:mono/diheme cytochrome c family protein
VINNRKRLFTLALGLATLGFSSLWAAEGTPTPEEQKKAQLFVVGAQLWPQYCATCHNPRGPSDRSPADWDLIMMHMRNSGNIPADDARAILEFLKKR